MNSKLSNDPHTVYGLKFDGVLFYIGCTHDLQKRTRGLFGAFKPLRRNRNKIKVVVLTECPNKISGNREETRIITEQIISGNQFLANATPSASLKDSTEELKDAWRNHQVRLGGALPGTQYGKRGFGSWGEMALGKVLNILNTLSKRKP